MMKYLNQLPMLFIAALFMLSLGACEVASDFPCATGDGARVSEERTIEGFNRIMLNMDADVYLHQDSAYAVTITAQNNLMSEITTELVGEVLEIDNARCIRQEKTIRIDITLPTLVGLELDGSGEVYGQSTFATPEMDLFVKGSGGIELEAITESMNLELGGSGNVVLDLQSDLLISKVKGTGDLFLTGSTSYHNSIVNASGDLNAFEFVTNQTDLTMNGAGDARIRVDSLLNVDILGSGNVFYKGHPSLNIEVSGSGEIKDAN